MDIRVLRYFLAVAREESITGAAEQLHMSQPPLSRQLKDLEDELGKQLFTRGSRKVTLTEEGMILRRRAEEIIELMDKTRAEIALSSEEISGELAIGGGETDGFRLLARALRRLRADYPRIRAHLYSGNAEDVTERLDRGLLDFGLVVQPADMRKYDFYALPASGVWGVLMRADCPLAQNATVRPEDLDGLPVLVSDQAMVENEISGWMGGRRDSLNVVGSYNLLNNAALMVEEGVGCALCLDGILRLDKNGPLCFRPFEPKLEVGIAVVWKKYQVFTKAAAKFIETLRAIG